jgi:hypothetical protein
MITGSKWDGLSRSLAIAAALATTLLLGAAAVLAAGAFGALGPHKAAAAPPASVSPIKPGPATGASGPTTPAGAPPRQHQTPTAITHVPLAHIPDPTAGLAIRFNGDAAADTPRPVLAPHVAGAWTNLGPYEVFHAVSTLEPCTSYTMTVPAGTRVEHHQPLGAARTLSFSVDCPGVTATQEALARLGYLPYTLHGFVGASSTAALTRRQAATRAYVLPHGKLLENVPDAPPLEAGVMDATTTGALEVYEEDHGLPLTTTPSRRLWVALFADETLAHTNSRPYTWVTVTESIPETLQVHEGSKIAISSPTNTGVPGAETAQGVFPIYARYVATTMIGTNVDGSHYDDPGVPWVNYFNGGDAVHGFIRPGYGYPQSNGCVELPIPTAETVFGMLQIGDLVIVE